MATRTRKTAGRRTKSRRPTTRRASHGGNPWTREDVAFIRKYYRNNPTSWCARQLGRTVYSIRYKACDLSIKKAAPSVWRGNKGATSATANRNTAKKVWNAKTGRWTRKTTRKNTTSRKWSRR